MKNTLVAILQFIVAQYTDNIPNTIAEYLTSGNDVFSNIVDIITKDIITFNNTLAEDDKIIDPNSRDFYNNPENTTNAPNTTNPEALNNYLLNTFFKILGKGAGDIFQEMNAICKHGGYTEVNYSKAPSIINWIKNGNDAGDAIRFFAAKDRPSACRFIFLTWFGKEGEINKKSLGGYIPEKDDNRLIVRKIYQGQPNNQNYDLCGDIGDRNTLANSSYVAAGAGKANTKKRKHSRKPYKKTKRHKKVKQLKRSKKYSQSKKHRKTNKRK